jgi:hypothetical protein
MPGFDPKRLHVRYIGNGDADSPIIPRKYTLTHSDTTGELFLSIGKEYDQKKLSNIYTRLMRDEVLGEWHDPEKPRLDIHCHTSGGIVVGTAGWRDSIFRHHMPVVLKAICYGDRVFISGKQRYIKAPVFVHFHSNRKSLDRTEKWGIIIDYMP